MMKRKYGAIIMAGAVAVSVLLGCGGGQKAADSNGAQENPGTAQSREIQESSGAAESVELIVFAAAF